MTGIADTVLKDISKIFSGGAVAHLLAIAALPVLARLYGPASYGVYGSLVAALTLGEILLSLRWELALVHRNGAAEFRSFTNSFWHLLGITTALAAALLALAWHWLPAQWQQLSGYILVLSPLVCLYSLLEMYCVKLGDYRRFGLARISKVALLVATQILLGLWSDNPGWRQLADAYAVSILGAIALVALSGTHGRQIASRLLPTRPFSFARSVELFRRESGHLHSNAPQALMNAAGQAVPYLLLAGAAAPLLGLFSMADRVIRAPLNLVSSSIKQVVTNRMAEQPHLAFPGLKQLLWLLAAGGIAAAVFFALFGDSFFALFLGEQWRGSGEIAFYLALYACGALLGLPLLATMRALRRHSTLVAFEALSLAAKFAAFYAAMHAWGALAGIAAYALASLGVALVFSWIAFGETRRHLVQSAPTA